MNETKCRAIVRTRSGERCEVCGQTAESMHHRRFRSQGGPWTPSNILHLCGDGARGCHGRITKTDGWRDVYEYLGWIVPRYQGWLTTPVLIRGERVLLDDAGGREAAR